MFLQVSANLFEGGGRYTICIMGYVGYSHPSLDYPNPDYLPTGYPLLVTSGGDTHSLLITSGGDTCPQE